MNLLRALATVSSLTMVSRVLGYLRDFLIARLFGASLATDAFFVAFKIPNLLRRMFAEGAFSQAFVPVLSGYKNRDGAEETRALIDRVATLLFLALVTTAVLGMALAPLIVHLTAPGFAADPRKFDLTVTLLRITFPYIAFISLVALAAGILNTWNRFSVPAITPALLNLSFIFGALLFAERFEQPVMVLAWAVFVGGALQLAFQVPFLVQLGMLPRWRLDWKHPGVRRVLTLMAPAAFGVSVSQVSLLINQVFASFLVTGSISWLYYADRLMELPAGVLGVALGTILLPSLSKYHATGNEAEYSRLLDWGLRMTLLLALPSAIALAVLALPVIATLFHYGRFTANDAWMTQQALVAYSIGLLGIILVKILAPGFYARQNIGTPVKIGIFTLVATQLMNLAFVVPLKHAGLALAIGLGACLNAALLYRFLRKDGFYIPQPGWALFFLKVAASVALMAVVLFTTMGEARWWLAAGWHLKLSAILGLVALGSATYGACLLAFGFRPRDFARRGSGLMGAPLEAFELAVRQDDQRIDLARACLLIAQDAYPELDVERYLAEIDGLAIRLRGRLPNRGGAEEKIMALNQFLFGDLGFVGNTRDYYDPRNSYLNEVIDRKTGIPITLAIVYMEIGRRIGLPLAGVSFPGHFLVRLKLRGGTLVLDPFSGGAPIAEDEMRERLQRVIPDGATDGVPVVDLPLDQFLEPATNRQILARLLRNLKGIYRETEKRERMLDVLNRMLVVAPDASGELRDRGIVYHELECYRAALKDLSDYVEREPDAPDGDEVRVRLMELSALCARLN